MELILVLILAAVGGYFLGKSKYGDSVDDAAGKVTETTKGAADNAEGWFRNRFGRNKDVVDVEATDVVSEDQAADSDDGKQPAEKTVSRRKQKTSEETSEEASES